MGTAELITRLIGLFLGIMAVSVVSPTLQKHPLALVGVCVRETQVQIKCIGAGYQGCEAG